MATTLVFSNEELSTTAMSYLKVLRNMLEQPRFYVDDMIKMKKDESGGERLIIPWETARQTVTTQMQTGYEPVSLAANPMFTPGNEAWFYAIRPIIMTTKDDIINRSKPKQIDLLERRTKSTEMGLKQEWEDQSLQDNQPTMSDLLPINGFDSTTGFLEAAAVGSQTNTVHNVSKATFSTLPGFQNQVFDIADSFSSNGLVGLYDMSTRVKLLAPDGTKLKWYASVAGTNNIKRALNSQERYLSSDKLDGGRRVLTYDDIPIVTTDAMPNAGTATTANPWTFLLQDWDSMGFVGQSGWVMKLDEFRDVSGHSARAAFMHLFGQNIVRYFGSSGVLHSGEVF